MATENALTNYGENALTDILVSNKYLALFSNDVGEGVTGTELSDGWYTRKAIPFAAAVGGTAVNSGVVDFGEVTGSAVYVHSWALYDAVSGGNAWVYGTFTKAKTASVDTNVLIQPGDVTVTGK